jgi:hypothetical protein
MKLKSIGPLYLCDHMFLFQKYSVNFHYTRTYYYGLLRECNRISYRFTITHFLRKAQIKLHIFPKG